ncbi:phage major capsid protein [Anaerospora hongkongensis]|uniref:phage major capsid protein n=1 Tax=Anaerospora hongkongensis TaxID=244830 RepID=UPI002FD88DC4
MRKEKMGKPFTFNLQCFALSVTELKQKMGALCDEQEKVYEKAMSEGRGPTTEEKKSFEDLQTQIDGLAETIKAAEAMEKRNKDLNLPDGKKFRAPSADMSTQDEKLDDGGFKSVGELLHAVKFGDAKGRLKELNSSDAGIMIPPAFAQNIMSLNPEKEIVMPRALVLPAGDPPNAPLSIPYFQQGDQGANGGVTLVWTAEGQEVPDAGNGQIKDLTLTPQEVSGLATVSNQTLLNWKAAGGFVEMTMKQAFVSGRDLKFLKGSGVGCPLGTFNAPGAIKIKRKTAGQIQYIDVVTMFSRLLPDAVSGAVWTANLTLMPVLMTLQDPKGNYIFNAGDATKGVGATLLGLPIEWNGKTPLAGREGDLALTNFSYYIIKPGAGPFISISEHVKFTSNKTVFKIVAYMDGQPWVKDPLKLEDGETTVSPYVILQ